MSFGPRPVDCLCEPFDDAPCARAHEPECKYTGYYEETWGVGAEVVAYGKPGVVRWVLPAGKGVCVVFGESGSDSTQMLWFYGEDIDLIEAA